MTFKSKLRVRAKKGLSASLLKYVSPEYVIIAPLLTEKTNKALGENKTDKKKYFFKVHSRATKVDVKLSIEKLYSVSVYKVNILFVVGKGRANRKTVRRLYKKAVVTLRNGQSIELF